MTEPQGSSSWINRRLKSLIFQAFQVIAFCLRLSSVGSINVDCTNGELDQMTNAFIQMSGVFAELELRIIRERVRSGMRNAKAKGARIGRPQTQIDDIPQAFLRHYPAFKSGQLNMSEFARVCNLSRTTAYKYVALLEQ